MPPPPPPPPSPPPPPPANMSGTVCVRAYVCVCWYSIRRRTQPELRQVFGAGEMFLGGIDKACASHNMTAQLCAGNPPSFLEVRKRLLCASLYTKHRTFAKTGSGQT
jgi:hypothetical protein